jgi:2,5-diketo-D-gluconate reductase A
MQNRTTSNVPTITLNNGVEIPQLGFGTYQIPPDETADAVFQALEVGYRHIDTAQLYRNEAGVGDGIRRFGVDRDEVFVTSKLNNGFHDYDDALREFDRSLERMQFDHLDLFLIHWPLPTVTDYVRTWEAMEAIASSGRARAIGVSNFEPDHLQRLFDATDTVPAVNQIEVHPYFRQDEVRAFDAEHGIATEAWSPIAQGEVLDDAHLTPLAEALDVSVAQIVLRWHLQRGDIVFPKTTSPERMRENFDVFDFNLDDDQMATIDGLNREARRGPDPATFDFIP